MVIFISGDDRKLAHTYFQSEFIYSNVKICAFFFRLRTWFIDDDNFILACVFAADGRKLVWAVLKLVCNTRIGVFACVCERAV